MNNKLLPIIIAATVGIILCAAVLVPVLNDAKGEFSQKYSNGPESASRNYATYSESADFTVTMTHSGAEWGVSGIDVNTKSGGAYILTDNAIMVLSQTYGFQIHGLTDAKTFVKLEPTSWNGTTADVSEISVHVSPSEISVTDTSGTQTAYTFPSSYAVYSDAEGDRVIVTSPSTIYTDGAKDIIAAGVNISRFFWSTNGEDSKVVYNEGLLDSELTYTLTEISEDVDTVTVGNGGTYTVGITFNGAHYDLTPTYVSVPRTLVQTTELGISLDPLFSAIPILVIIAMVVMCAGVIIRRD